jgi:hypothetical protein
MLSGLLVVGALLWAGAMPLCAWGAKGHRAISLVTERYISPETRYAVEDLLDGESIAQASTWADEIKSERKWDFASPWHYVNLDDGERYATAPKNPAGDVIEAITRLRTVLEDRTQPRQKRAEALRFLIHLVGDIHQPLHVGRRSDRGGNDVKVFWFGRETNIHAVWDSSIIDHWDLSYTELASYLKMPDEAQRKRWQQDDVMTWAEESIAYRAKIYEIGDGRLSYEYGYVHGSFLKQRLVQAGVRLAGLLNAVFGR